MANCWSVQSVLANALAQPLDERPEPAPLRFVVIVPCGATKAAEAQPACSLYLGSYHRGCRRYAHSVQPERRGVFILSALHGLLALSDWVEPYELTFGQPGAVSPATVRDQATKRGLWWTPALVLGGRRYVEIARQAFEHVHALSDDMPPGSGLGRQLAYFKNNEGRLPPSFADTLKRSA